MAGYPGPWENPDRGGIIPGATTYSIRDARMVAESRKDIPVAPGLAEIRGRMSAPRWAATFIQYYDAADAGRFHASPIYARIVQSRAIDTVDALVPISPPLAVDAAKIQQEIQTARAAAVSSATQSAAASAQTYLAQYEQAFTSGGG